MGPRLGGRSGAALLPLLLPSMGPSRSGHPPHHHYASHVKCMGPLGPLMVPLTVIAALVHLVDATPLPLSLTSGQPDDVELVAAGRPVRPVATEAISADTRRMVEMW